MPAITKDQALERLAGQVREKFGPDELLEVYNEVFPDDPRTEEDAHKDTRPLIEKLVDHIRGGREMEEIIDLWGLIFPRHRNVWYDDEAERIHYNEGAEAVSAE
jgi:plasmid stabilization system protein ParE